MLAIYIIILGVLLRIVPHAPNFAPIAATALFGGAYLKRRYAIILPLITMLVSDYLLLYFHPFGPGPLASFNHIYSPTVLFGWSNIYVLGSFVLIGGIGMWLKNHKNARNVIGASLVSSVLFFLITNFGVWAGGMYDRNISGLATSYIMGIPFFRNTLAGDLFYTGAFFGSYELVKVILARKSPALLKLFK